MGEGLNTWCQALVQRFKESQSVALSKFTTERFTLSNVRNHRQPSHYIQSIIRYAKGANMDSIYNQLTFAYNDLDLDLRRDIQRSTESTTILSFTLALEAKKKVWQDIYRRQYAPSRPVSHTNYRPVFQPMNPNIG